MIRTPTVFVLGAGASAPYGYPLGDALTVRIRELTKSNGGIWDLLVAKYGAVAPVLNFHHALTDSDPRSIDDFLESNPQFLDIGKVCIAAALTVYGPPSEYPVSPALHWYRYLWQLMHAEAATSNQFRGNHVKVVTYNYDTSLERYLRQCVRGMYADVSKDGAAERLLADVLPVVHVHGSLGGCDSEVLPEADRSRFNDVRFFERGASGVRIVHEDERTEEYAKAHTWIRSAKVVCFLGFGYHPTNVRRLRFKELLQGTAMTFIGGTCLGLGEAERSRALALFDLGFRGEEFPVSDAREFLRQKFVW